MRASAVSDQVRTQVRDLSTELNAEIAEDIALAMVAGAAQGFMDITEDGARCAVLRLLGALNLDLETALAAVAN